MSLSCLAVSASSAASTRLTVLVRRCTSSSTADGFVGSAFSVVAATTASSTSSRWSESSRRVALGMVGAVRPAVPIKPTVMSRIVVARAVAEMSVRAFTPPIVVGEPGVDGCDRFNNMVGVSSMLRAVPPSGEPPLSAMAMNACLRRPANGAGVPNSSEPV